MSRAMKSGDAFRTEQKLEQRYDDEDKLGVPKAVVEWVQAATQGKCPPLGKPTTAGLSWEDIQGWMKDGVVLCSLINQLLSGEGKPPVKFNLKAKTAFVAMANVEAFNDGCRAYGVSETALFQTADLVEGRKAQMVNIINCLNKLGFTANDKGFTPFFNPPAAPKADF